MPPSQRYWTFLAFLALVLPASAGSDLSVEEADRNRRLFEQYRTDPDHLRRLVNDYKAFRSLPKNSQARLRQLDRAQPGRPAQARALVGRPRTLQRVDRRIAGIRPRAGRGGAWLRAPAAHQGDLRPAMGRSATGARSGANSEIACRAPGRRSGSAAAAGPPPPARLAKGVPGPAEHAASPDRPTRLVGFPADVQTFVTQQLTPLLSAAEKEQVAKAEGNWPLLALAVFDLAERHPILPPIQGRTGVTRYKELPPQLKLLLPRRFMNPMQWAALHRAEGRWPNFALAFTELARFEEKKLPFQLGASRPREFSPAVQQVLETKLEPALTEANKERLKAAEGKWPEYPKLLHELARATRSFFPA